MLWTSKAPLYDMDFARLNKQRVRHLQFRPRFLGDLHETLDCNQTHLEILPFLARKRLNMFSCESKTRRCMQVIYNEKLKKNRIKLPSLSKNVCVSLKHHRTPSGSFCTEIVKAKHKDVASLSFPPSSNS